MACGNRFLSKYNLPFSSVLFHDQLCIYRMSRKSPTQALQDQAFKNRWSFAAKSSRFLVSHCQTARTLQPERFSSSDFRRSLSIFSSSLRFQYSVFEEGRLDLGHPGCWCQKQPCTNRTPRYLGRTMSGVPGRSFLCKRNRNPMRWSNDLTISSGPVPF